MAAPADIDEYLAALPDDRRATLQAVREAIHRGVASGSGASEPAAEKIRYGMPAVLLDGRYAVHFAAWKKHLGLYPVATLSAELEERVAPLRSGADSVTIPWTTPAPLELIEAIATELAARRRSV
jgi:uncharacterized protein YdhG (YjbR/CyaY superfamily)